MKQGLHSVVTYLVIVLFLASVVSCGNPPPLPTRADVQSKSSNRSVPVDDKGLLATVAASVFNRTAVKMIAWEYDDFFRTAKLDPQKERRVREILTEKQAGMMFAAGRFVLQNGDPEGDSKSLDAVAAATAERDKQLATILSPEELRRLRDYESPNKVAERLTPERLAKLFPDLLNEKQGRAGQVMAEELNKDGANPVSVLQNKEAYRNLCNQVRTRLGQEFSPDEMKNVEEGLGHLQDPREAVGR